MSGMGMLWIHAHLKSDITAQIHNTAFKIAGDSVSLKKQRGLWPFDPQRGCMGFKRTTFRTTSEHSTTVLFRHQKVWHHRLVEVTKRIFRICTNRGVYNIIPVYCWSSIQETVEMSSVTILFYVLICIRSFCKLNAQSEISSHYSQTGVLEPTHASNRDSGIPTEREADVE